MKKIIKANRVCKHYKYKFISIKYFLIIIIRAYESICLQSQYPDSQNGIRCKSYDIIIFYEAPSHSKRNGLVSHRAFKFASVEMSRRANKSGRAGQPPLRRAGRSILASSLTSRYCDYIRVCANVIYIDGLVSACQAFNPFTVFDIHTRTQTWTTYAWCYTVTRPCRYAHVHALTYAVHADFPMCRLYREATPTLWLAYEFMVLINYRQLVFTR